MHRMSPSRFSRTPLVIWSCAVLPALALALGCSGHVKSQQPVLAGFTPAAGQASSMVTVYGSGLNQGLLATSIGGIAIPLYAVEVGTTAYTTEINIGNSSVTFPVPPNAVSGPIVVTTNGGSVTTAQFIVIPVVGTVTPTSGSLAAGTSVTVDGSGLMGVTQVLFGTTAATMTTHTANQIVVALPAGAAQGAGQMTFVVDPTYNLPNPQAAFTVNP